MPARLAGPAVGAGLVLLLAAGCATTPSSSAGSSTPSATPTPAAAHLTTERCADLVVLGLRGQGQSRRTEQGVGAEVRASVQAVVTRLPHGVSVRLEAVPYPNGSDATYDADVARGQRMARSRLSALARRCPHSRLALVGYSEGAQAVHLAALRLTPHERDRLALVAVLGDPLRNPDDPTRVVDYGTGPLAGRGNAGPGPAFPASTRARTLSFCVRGDNVCNAPLTGRVGTVSATHRGFYERSASARTTGRALAGVLRSVP